MGLQGIRFSEISAGRFLPGFSWPVDRAFTDAVRLCAFEEGDVLHSSERAAGPWLGIEQLAPLIQVQRSDARANNSFDQNWGAWVWLKVWGQGGREELIDCPMGCLFRVLEEGDLEYLHRDDPGEPPCGAGTKLRQTIKSWGGITGKFTVPFDVTVWESVWKAARICRKFDQDPVVANTQECRLSLLFRPTVYMALIDVSGLSKEEITERVRRGVNPNSETVALGRHGVLAQ